MSKAKLLGLLVCTALFWGVGCSAPQAPAPAKSATQQLLENTHTFHMAASDATAKAYGITQWHMMIEGSSRSVVIDGSDGKGAIKFSTSFRSAKTALQVHDYKRNQKLSITQKGNQLLIQNSLTNTDKWQKTVAAFSVDWASGQATQEYGFFKQAGTFFQQSSQLATNIARVSVGVGVVATLAGPVTGGVGDAIAVPAFGVAGLAYETAGVLSKAAKISNALDWAFPNVPEVGSKDTPANEDKSTTADQGNSTADKPSDNGLSSDQANGNGNGASDPATPDTISGTSQPSSDTLSPDLGGNSTGASGDNGLSSDQGNGNGNGASDPGTFQPGAGVGTDNGLSSDQGNGNGDGASDPSTFTPPAGDPGTSDNGLSSDQGNGNGEGAQIPDNNVDANLDQSSVDTSSSDDGSGGGDDGSAAADDGSGSDDAEQALHRKCVAVSCSKSTNVCICKKY